MWKSGIDVDKLYETIKQPFLNGKIYIANEAFSKHQGWIEGSLDMCYDVLSLIDPLFKKIKGGNFKSISNSNRSNSKKLKKTKKPKSNKYTINEVLNHKYWIILKINNDYRIYDVKKWMNKHPGGKNNLLENSVNKYYLILKITINLQII